MKHPLLGKVVALGAVTAVLLMALGAVDGLVGERQQRQAEAERNVAESLAGAQTLLGPALQRRCLETWHRTEGEGRDRRVVTDRREFMQVVWPRRLDVTGRVTVEPRHRGLFKVNTFLAASTVSAEWGAMATPAPRAGLDQAEVACEATTMVMAVTDPRGIRSARVAVAGATLPVRPVDRMVADGRGLQVDVPVDATAQDALRAEITLDLVGTGSLAWVPAGEETTVAVSSDWAHPSFAGRFLPTSREVTDAGFEARWQTTALATTAQQRLGQGGRVCSLGSGAEVAGPDVETDPSRARVTCVDSFGIHFVDPVRGLVLSERATKYGLLFILLTFVGVALVEVMRRVRVHPMQYLLVGFALTMFFLLLVSLGEHLAFGVAYLCASLACTALLTFYGVHVLRGTAPGLVFGVAVGLLYGVLYVLLQLEQTALVFGSLLLFTALATVMVATRRMDWYALTLRGPGADRQAPSPASTGA